MSTTLIVESDGNRVTLLEESALGLRRLASLQGSDECNLTFADLSSAELDRVESVELRVREEDIQSQMERIGVVLSGLPQRAADGLKATGKILNAASIDIHGNIHTPLDEGALRRQVAALAGTHALSAWVVSGMNSHRNPVHEQRAASIAQELTGCPAIAGRFWSDALNAVDRASIAMQGAARVIHLEKLVRTHEQIVRRLGRAIRIRTTPLDPALLAALLNCPSLLAIVRRVEESAGAGPSLQARVTRSEKGYSCHCTDGYFEFESITQAKSFAAQHLREQMSQHAHQLGLSEEATQIVQEDRYTQVRGKRGPVRVYLETIFTARRYR